VSCQIVKRNNNKDEGSLEMASLGASATHVTYFFFVFEKKEHRAASDEKQDI
jgi:hypothetical protein